MNPGPTVPCVSHKRHRFPAEIISHCVWLYDRFGLSLRDVQDLMAERGVAVTYETVHQWYRKFGPPFAQTLRRRRPHPGEKWHIDEVQLKMNGRRYWLWRTVDQDGLVLDILVQERRNRTAAEAFLRRVVDGCGCRPRVVVTDKLASYPPAIRRVLPGAEHRRHTGLNNRAENSRRPTRRRERAMQRFKSAEPAQRFLAAFEPIRGRFCPRRHLRSAARYREALAARFHTWQQVTGLAASA